jgi:hypothetical protein
MLLSCRLEVRTEQIEGSCDGHAAEVGSTPATYGQSPTLHFSVANHKHKWNLRLLRFSNFQPNFFIPKVCLSAEPRNLELGHDLGDVGRAKLGRRRRNAQSEYQRTVRSIPSEPDGS